MEEDKKEQNTEDAHSANSGQATTKKQENTETQVGENSENSKNEEVADEKKQEETEQPTEEAVEEIQNKNIKKVKNYPDVIPGANVKIYQKIKEKKGKEEKERLQIFEGIVLARKGGNSAGATITVRKICKGGFEVRKIFPIHLPAIAKIEVLRQAKVRRAKLGFLNKHYKKKLKYKNTKEQK